MVFESIKCRELSDIDGDIVPSFQSRIMKAFLDVFKIISWDYYVSAVCALPCHFTFTFLMFGEICSRSKKHHPTFPLLWGLGEMSGELVGRLNTSFNVAERTHACNRKPVMLDEMLSEMLGRLTSLHSTAQRSKKFVRLNVERNFRFFKRSCIINLSKLVLTFQMDVRNT